MNLPNYDYKSIIMWIALDIYICVCVIPRLALLTGRSVRAGPPAKPQDLRRAVPTGDRGAAAA